MERLIKRRPLFSIYCPICKFTNAIPTPEICLRCRKELTEDISIIPVGFKPKEENYDRRR